MNKRVNNLLIGIATAFVAMFLFAIQADEAIQNAIPDFALGISFTFAVLWFPYLSKCVINKKFVEFAVKTNTMAAYDDLFHNQIFSLILFVGTNMAYGYFPIPAYWFLWALFGFAFVAQSALLAIAVIRAKQFMAKYEI